MLLFFRYHHALLSWLHPKRGDVHFILTSLPEKMAALSYGHVLGQSRAVQLGCLVLKIFLLYANIDYLGTMTFIFTTALCIYNLYVVGRRWANNIDGRFDFRQMLKETNTQLKLSYASEVFSPTIVGFLVFLMVRMPGGGSNFMWTMACCVQIAASLLLLALEFHETMIKGK
ncbi:hypothetical protein Y032_0222g2627 [Ancylostoma ceylanicum]|nr:hypothetical protein Y032_0222g2627 [Ancylostoma ceylanicum]